MVSRLRRFFDIRSGEGLPLLLSFSYIAIVIASLVLAKAVRNGLFIEQYGPYALVYVYALSPLVLTLFVPLHTRLAIRIGTRRIAPWTLGFFAANAVYFWWAFGTSEAPSLPGVLYVWVNCFGVIAPVHAWAYTSGLFDGRQAKRLFGLIGSGASVGAIAGGLLARLLVDPIGGPINLLLVLAGLMLVAALTVLLANARLAYRGQSSGGPAPLRSFRATLGEIAGSPYLRLVAALVLLGAIATQWTSLQLSLVATEHFGQDAAALTRFNGTFSTVFAAVGVCVQLFVTRPALQRFGLTVTLLALPMSLGVGTAAIVLAPAFWPVIVTGAFDQSLRFSVDRPSYELLYLPFMPGERLPLKSAIDILVTRIADSLGAVLYGLATIGFLVLPGAAVGLRGTAVINLAIIGAWLAVAWRLRGEYVRTIHQSIHRNRLDTERSDPATLERSAADALRSRLQAANPDDVRYALELLEGQRTRSWHPALRSLLDHPEPDIRRRALALLAGSGDLEIASAATRLLRDPDAGVRTEALLFVAREGGIDPLAQVAELGDFPDFSIRAGMAAFLASPGPAQNLVAAGAIVTQMVGATGPEGARERAEAARLIAIVPHAFVEPLARLIADPDPEVAREAIHTAAAIVHEDTIESLLTALARPETADDASLALSKFGTSLVPLVSARLNDPRVALELRRELPSVLVRIGTADAEEALIAALLQADPTLRHRIVASLNKLRVLHPDVRIDPQTIELLLAAEIAGHYRSYQVLGPLRRRLRDDDPVLQGIQHSMEQERERIFRLMALLLPQTGLHDAYVGLRSANPVIRANALEFLDTVLKPELRQVLVPLLDGHVSLDDRVEMANRLVGAPLETPEQAVTTLLASEDGWLQSCGLYAIGALQLNGMQDDLERFESSPDATVSESARSARRRLSGVDTQRAPAMPVPSAIGGEIGAG